jgi:hypothetical protein
MEPALNNKAFLLIPMTLFFLKKKLIDDFAVKEGLYSWQWQSCKTNLNPNSKK